MNVHRLRHWVSLSRSPQETNDADGFFEPLTPEHVRVAIRPSAPGGGEGRTLFHEVDMRYHPEVSLDTRIVYGTRELFVRGMQNVDERDHELRLLCEEVQK